MLNNIEMKLLRLALDKGAYAGEADNAAVMLMRKLRERGAEADDFYTKAQTPECFSWESDDIDIYEKYKMPFGKYKNEMLADIPADYLMWVLRNCRNISYGLRNAIERIINYD